MDSDSNAIRRKLGFVTERGFWRFVNKYKKRNYGITNAELTLNACKAWNRLKHSEQLRFSRMSDDSRSRHSTGGTVLVERCYLCDPIDCSMCDKRKLELMKKKPKKHPRCPARPSRPDCGVKPEPPPDSDASSSQCRVARRPRKPVCARPSRSLSPPPRKRKCAQPRTPVCPPPRKRRRARSRSRTSICSPRKSRYARRSKTIFGAPRKPRRARRCKQRGVGPLTNNGYLNFIRTFRKRNKGLYPTELVRQAAKAWMALPEETRNRYRRQACRVRNKKLCASDSSLLD